MRITLGGGIGYGDHMVRWRLWQGSSSCLGTYHIVKNNEITWVRLNRKSGWVPEETEFGAYWDQATSRQWQWGRSEMRQGRKASSVPRHSTLLHKKLWRDRTGEWSWDLHECLRVGQDCLRAVLGWKEGEEQVSDGEEPLLCYLSGPFWWQLENQVSRSMVQLSLEVVGDARTSGHVAYQPSYPTTARGRSWPPGQDSGWLQGSCWCCGANWARVIRWASRPGWQWGMMVT
jgi:hypothetical protein